MTKDSSFLQKLLWFAGISSDFEERCDELDRMAAQYTSDYPFHAVRQKNLYDLVQSLKSRSRDNEFSTFVTLLFNLDGAYQTREPNGMLQLTHSLITNANSTTIKADRNLRGLSTVLDYAFGASKGCSYPLGEIHHPTDGLTTLTAANTAAFTRFDGLEKRSPTLRGRCIRRRHEHLR